MSTKRIKEIELAGRKAVLALRKAKHEKGYPFMINCSTLPPDQCYLEYPDGDIEIVTLSKSRMDFERVWLWDDYQVIMLKKA